MAEIIVGRKNRFWLKLRKPYYFQGVIQFDEYGEVVEMGCTVIWLEKLKIYAHNRDSAEKAALNYFKKKYPQYNDEKGYTHIQLF